MAEDELSGFECVGVTAGCDDGAREIETWYCGRGAEDEVAEEWREFGEFVVDGVEGGGVGFYEEGGGGEGGGGGGEGGGGVEGEGFGDGAAGGGGLVGAHCGGDGGRHSCGG